MNELKKLGFTPKDLLLLNEARRETRTTFGMKVWFISALFWMVGFLYIDIRVIALGGIFMILTVYIQYLNNNNRDEYADKIVKFAFGGKKKC
jgi:hypothetical protein